jgi:hypothetical protein
MKGFIKGTNKDDLFEIEKIKCEDGCYRYKSIDTGELYELGDIVITENKDFLVVNFHSSPVNVSHFQGTSRDRLGDFMELVKTKSTLELPEGLTVLTTYTDPDKCILYQQLNKSGINCLNTLDYLNNLDEEGWSMTKKIDLIREGLKHVDTEIVLICDGYDVYINSFDNILQKFKSTGLKMLFNGTKNNFPATHVDRIPYRDWRGEYRYFNAGCAIGYKDDFIKFYDDCAEIIDKVSNPWDSEQLILRHVFAKYSENVNSDNPYMDFDWECNIFQTYVNSIVLKLYKDQEVYAVL